MELKTNFARYSRLWTATMIGGAALVAGACSDTSSPRPNGASISFHVVKGAASGANARLSPSFALVEGEGHTLDIQTVDITFDHITFVRSHGTSASADEVSDTASDDTASDDTASDDTASEDSASDDSASEDSTSSDSTEVEDGGDDEGHGHTFHAGATTVSLNLDGDVTTAFTGTIPFGTYSRLLMKAEYVRMRGTYDGEAFDVTIPVHAMLNLPFSPALVVDADHPNPNVTINVNVLDWFRTSTGGVVDPNILNSSHSARGRFVKKIRADFRAFRDENRNGDDSDEDDDNGHGHHD